MLHRTLTAVPSPRSPSLRSDHDAVVARAVATVLEAAQACAQVGEFEVATSLLEDCQRLWRRRPNAPSLPRQLTRLRRDLHELGAGSPDLGEVHLTRAETRLLPLLATHLSFAGIANELFISRHTVKTQAISIYRKLNVSSRSEAVVRAQELGLS